MGGIRRTARTSALPPHQAHKLADQAFERSGLGGQFRRGRRRLLRAHGRLLRDLVHLRNGGVDLIRALDLLVGRLADAVDELGDLADVGRDPPSAVPTALEASLPLRTRLTVSSIRDVVSRAA